MGSFLFWLLVVVSVVALVVLFFPFRLFIRFEAGESGARVRFFFFGRNVWTYKKKWKGDDADKEEADKDEVDKDADAAPAYVATHVSKPVEAKAAPAALPEPKASEPETPKPETPKPETPKPAAPAPEKKPEPPAEKDEKPAEKDEQEKPEKRKLTDEEFWTIILTPDMDARAFRYVKRLLASLVRVFRIRFKDCFVEGIRSDYKTMGYGAAANAIMKGFPYISAWDFRMDWTHEKELHAEGCVIASVNLCRVLAFTLETVLYACVLLFLFWRRRSHILKTGELPELGYVRKKILNFIVEE